MTFDAPSVPLKVEDAAGRRYTVLFKKVSAKKVTATVKGQGLNEKIDLEVQPPVYNWGWYARQALKTAIKNKYGTDATRTKDDDSQPQEGTKNAHVQMRTSQRDQRNSQPSNPDSLLPPVRSDTL